MEMKFADRLQQIDAGIFSELNDRKNELIAFLTGQTANAV